MGLGGNGNALLRGEGGACSTGDGNVGGDKGHFGDAVVLAEGATFLEEGDFFSVLTSDDHADDIFRAPCVVLCTVRCTRRGE